MSLPLDKVDPPVWPQEGRGWQGGGFLSYHLHMQRPGHLTGLAIWASASPLSDSTWGGGASIARRWTASSPCVWVLPPSGQLNQQSQKLERGPEPGCPSVCLFVCLFWSCGNFQPAGVLGDPRDGGGGLGVLSPICPIIPLTRSPSICPSENLAQKHSTHIGEGCRLYAERRQGTRCPLLCKSWPIISQL